MIGWTGWMGEGAAPRGGGAAGRGTRAWSTKRWWRLCVGVAAVAVVVASSLLQSVEFFDPIHGRGAPGTETWTSAEADAV